MSDNVFDYNAAALFNAGTDNLFANNRVLRCEAGGNGYFYQGMPVSGPAGAAVFIGPGLSTTSANSGLEMGSTTIAGTAFVDFHSSGGPRDYDSRIIGSGGSATANGQGTLTFVAGLFNFYGPLALPNLPAGASYASDAAAATGGVPVGQLYRNGSAVQVRVA